MTLYGYCRVSSEDQVRTGKSLEAQREILLKNGVQPNNIYIDGGKSGGIHEEKITQSYTENRYFTTKIDLKERKEFNKLLSIIKPGDTITFVKWDRLGRIVSFVKNFAQWAERKEIILKPIEEGTEPLIRDILLIVAESELSKTRDRNQSIQEYQFEEGIYPYASPYGYTKNVKENDILRYPDVSEGALIINEEQANIIRECFKTAIKSRETKNNTLYRELCAKYDIDPSTYYRIIKNRIYTGCTQYKKKYKKSEYVPAIITEKEWEKANKQK